MRVGRRKTKRKTKRRRVVEGGWKAGGSTEGGWRGKADEYEGDRIEWLLVQRAGRSSGRLDLFEEGRERQRRVEG